MKSANTCNKPIYFLLLKIVFLFHSIFFFTKQEQQKFDSIHMNQRLNCDRRGGEKCKWKVYSSRHHVRATMKRAIVAVNVASSNFNKNLSITLITRVKYDVHSVQSIFRKNAQFRNTYNPIANASDILYGFFMKNTRDERHKDEMAKANNEYIVDVLKNSHS